MASMASRKNKAKKTPTQPEMYTGMMKSLKQKTKSQGSSSTADPSSTNYNRISNLIQNMLSERTKDFRTATVEYHTIPVTAEDSRAKSIAEQATYNELHANIEMKLFEVDEDAPEVPEREDDFEVPLSDYSRTGYFFEKAGIGFGQEETYRILLGLKSLAMECMFVHVRFWGKMLGIKSNYYIAETEFREGEGDAVQPETSEVYSEQVPQHYTQINIESDIEEPEEDEGLPKPDWKEPEPVQAEEHHHGANRYVYFVCSKLGEPWVKLPHVTPTEIAQSRKITKLLTGNLEQPIESYPKFVGKEENYLRALIARISAGTQISPSGYYVFDDEGNEEEDSEEVHDSYVVNIAFDGIPVRQLEKNYRQNWIHHAQYLLPQGRCSWWSPSNSFRDDFDEDEEFDDENMIPQETGPVLLTNLAGDKNASGNPAWSATLTSEYMPQHGICIMKSNQWPGAYAYSNGKQFDNVYIGWGQKHSADGHNQPFPPASIEEYVKCADVIEEQDPSLEQEEEAKLMEELANNADTIVRANEAPDDEDDD